MRVLFATAELVPLTRVGGLGEASAGLVRALRASGIEVDVVLPDYGAHPLVDEVSHALAVPSWAGPASVRTGISDGLGRMTLIGAPAIAKPHPYNDPATGEGWPDNVQRFFGFSAAVAALASEARPDVLHVNDWHTAPVLGMLASPVPSVLTIHNLAYQGVTGPTWLDCFPTSRAAYERGGDCNPLAGGLELADRVVAVSPTYAKEIVRAEGGFGLDDVLRGRGTALSGIRNGIDTTTWSPAADAHIARNYDSARLEGKAECRGQLLRELAWDETGGPLIAMVTRFTEQKGVDLAFDIVPGLSALGARLVVLGSGDRTLATRARELASAHQGVMRFTEDFNEGLAHRMFAACDLLLMPSRFEPCGLTQMQAMAYGTIPIVTPVGGLVDTVIDVDSGDAQQASGNGFVMTSIDEGALLDALTRAVTAWREPSRRLAIQRAGMTRDWSWRLPAEEYRQLYEAIANR